jgi:hypothetical protein
MGGWEFRSSITVVARKLLAYGFKLKILEELPVTCI